MFIFGLTVVLYFIKILSGSRKIYDVINGLILFKVIKSELTEKIEERINSMRKTLHPI